MSLTVQDLIDTTNKAFRDSSNDSKTEADRLAAISEACLWLIEKTTNDHTIKTAQVQYVPTVNKYKMSQIASDVFTPVDLRRDEDKQTIPATYKSSREMAEDIANSAFEFAYTIERANDSSYLIVNLPNDGTASTLLSLSSLTSDGTFTATGDADTLSSDSRYFKSGNGSVSFNVNAALSVSNFAGVELTTTAHNIFSYESIGAFLLWVYIPDVTAVTSFSLKVGETNAKYWLMTTTVNSDGDAFANGWNKLLFRWSDATKIGLPLSENTAYYAFILNYGAGQPNMAGVKINLLDIAIPEVLTFYFNAQSIGKSNSGALLTAFTATTDIPYFSGKYDNYRYAVGHRAAGILFGEIVLPADMNAQFALADDALRDKQKLIPSSTVREERQFKPRGVNFTKRKN